MEYYEVRRQVVLLLSLILGKPQAAQFFVHGLRGKRTEVCVRQIEDNPVKNIVVEFMKIYRSYEHNPYQLLWMGARFETTTGDTHELTCNLYGDVILRPDIQAEGGK